MVAIAQKSHHYCTTHSLRRENDFFRRPNLSSLYRNLILVSTIKWCLTAVENIQEVRSDGAWNASFCALLMPAYNVAGSRNHWPNQGPSKGRVIFYDVGFSAKLRSCRTSLKTAAKETIGLSQVSEMLRQFTGQISAHYSSSKIRNTHLRLFCPDQGPHTVRILGDFPKTEFSSAYFTETLLCYIFAFCCYHWLFGSVSRKSR